MIGEPLIACAIGLLAFGMLYAAGKAGMGSDRHNWSEPTKLKRRGWDLLDLLFHVIVCFVVLLINGWTFAVMSWRTLRERRRHPHMIDSDPE